MNNYRKYFFNLLKNHKQYNISTWHGTPLKNILIDSKPQTPNFSYFTTSNIFCVGSIFESDIFRRSFNEAIIKVTGYPRNDILFNLSNEKKELIKKGLNLSTQKKYVIYAPTFRDTLLSEGLNDRTKNYNYLMNMNVDSVLKALNKRFGGEWEFIFRGHQFIQKEVNYDKFNDHKTSIINGNLHDDMAQYLAVCDILITDYSSSIFDFLIT